ncbi:MAG TPA: GNAT family N-acetyltransferase [Frateuria sp.]|uniref:GNAT family N-acetyltransferase n=1 Tax=Frateuria sp. TaxID=2211372 RepID=UPI002DEECBA6|nr:GNAT family N-acetyltransferase [Frateuria sp.]
MTADAGYRVEAADLPRDREAVLGIWHGSLGDPARHAGKFDWFYRRCPFGEPATQLLRHHGVAIGCCTAAPRRMLWQGREIRAGLLADMAVAAQHRTLGPALMLQEALVQAAGERYELLYGFPNRKSLPVVRRLGYAVLGALVRHSKVLRHGPYLERHLPRWLARPLGRLLDAGVALWERPRARRRTGAEWSARADPRMDALWRASTHGAGLVGVRDATMARWRFDESPLASTRYLLVGDHPGGPLRAWFACQSVGAVLRVADYWSETGAAGIDGALVLALVHAARREGYTSISLEHAIADERLAGWRRAGFVPRDSQPVVGKWLGEGGPSPAELAQGWHLTSADEDE